MNASYDSAAAGADVIRGHLVALYGPQAAEATAQRLEDLLARYAPRIPASGNALNERDALTERDAVLITYGDQVSEPGAPPLRSLAEFAGQALDGVVSTIHILPFYPYTSDDGFSVVDYQAVDPALGEWTDIERLGRRFALMFDAVINHISTRSAWFQGFLWDEPNYRDFFITVEGDPDLSQVVRPRALPLLTEFSTASGLKRVWTTFSSDQVDLNYANPEVLLAVIETLLFYVTKKARLIRLDAIAYLWKEIGTACIHLPQTHRVVQLLRAVLDRVAPRVLLITETNVPHQDNLSYFGDGFNEAQLVYNFALPPLTLHTFLTGDATALRDWAATLALPSSRTTFFNFLASHDGVGLNPARGILTPEQIDRLVESVQQRGGLVSYKHNPDGSQSPYELNISYFDALSDPQGGETLKRQADRFAAAHAIQFALLGMPGVYFHSLFGSRNWLEGVRETGRNRTINRQKLSRAGLERALSQPDHLRALVFERLSRLLRARAASPAFHPYGSQRILDGGPGVFALWRSSPYGGHKQGEGRVLCLHNVTHTPQTFRAPEDARGTANDRLNGETMQIHPGVDIHLGPYQVRWLQM